MNNFGNDMKDAVELITQRLADHLAKEPLMPKGRQMLLDDATPEAIKAALNENNPSIGIIADEAAETTGGRTFSNLPMFNTAWNGGDLKVNRRSGNFTIRNPRLTVALMIQEMPFRDFLDGRGLRARDVGSLARFLVSFPASTMGFRTYNGQNQSWEALEKFHERISELFVSDEKRVLHLSPDAESAWINAYNTVESLLKPGLEFADVKDFASKIAENILRISAIFHVVQRYEGDQISADTVNRAISISQWYTGEFVRLFSPNHGIPEEQVDADALIQWFLAHQNTQRCHWINGLAYFKTAEILRYGPGSLRKCKQRVEAALDYLALQNRIRFSAMAKTSYVQLVLHNPMPNQNWGIPTAALGHM